jgi:GNAT superfamily N-acetyltransferase
MLTIRQGRPSDIPAIAEFNRRLALETEHRVLEEATLVAGVAAVLSDPNRGQYYVAELHGKLVGQLLITTEWSDWRNGWFWWIQSVYVHAEARRQGVFSALYQHVREQALQAGNVVGLRLYVERENKTAQQTYQRLGFKDVGYLLLERGPL